MPRRRPADERGGPLRARRPHEPRRAPTVGGPAQLALLRAGPRRQPSEAARAVALRRGPLCPRLRPRDRALALERRVGPIRARRAVRFAFGTKAPGDRPSGARRLTDDERRAHRVAPGPRRERRRLGHAPRPAAHVDDDVPDAGALPSDAADAAPPVSTEPFVALRGRQQISQDPPPTCGPLCANCVCPHSCCNKPPASSQRKSCAPRRGLGTPASGPAPLAVVA